MGWTTCYSASYYLPNGKVDRRRECDKLFTWNRVGKDGTVNSGEVLKSAMVGSVYYAAVRVNGGKVSAAICLTCGKNRYHGTIWGYKDMDETMGPCESKCPAGILALLSPTDSKYANEWRERCREYIREKALARRNIKEPMYAPKGVTITEEGRSWVITSREYQRANIPYRGVKFSKKVWNSNYMNALVAFLAKHGTAEQKAEFASTGRQCPSNWKSAVA